MRIDSFYMWGTEGYLNLFFRPKGTLVQRVGDTGFEDYISPKDVYIIQWDGETKIDSGYAQWAYLTLSEAKEAFAIRRRE